VSKPHALKAWRSLGCEKYAQTVCDGLKRWVVNADWKERPADKLPYPATWLHGERWNDQPSADVRPSKPGRLRLQTFSDSDNVWIRHQRSDAVRHELSLTDEEAVDLHYLLSLALKEKDLL
jgi:hypothetical protein